MNVEPIENAKMHESVLVPKQTNAIYKNQNRMALNGVNKIVRALSVERFSPDRTVR